MPYPQAEYTNNPYMSDAVNLLNGTGVREDELSVLVMPGEEAVFEIRVPNGPVSRERAKAIARLDYDLHYRSCRAYWNSILKEAAPVSLPEKELENRLKAGILHTVMATTGEQSEVADSELQERLLALVGAR